MGFPRIHDTAFGQRGYSNLYAYRLDAKANLFSLGYNFAISRQSAFDIAYRYTDADAVNYNSYQRNNIELAYLHRF